MIEQTKGNHFHIVMDEASVDKKPGFRMTKYVTLALLILLVFLICGCPNS